MAGRDVLRAPVRGLSWLAALVTRLRQHPPAERWAFWQISGLAVVLAAAGLTVGLSAFPPSTQVVPLLLGGLLLRRAAMRRVSLVVAACLAVELARSGPEVVRPGAIVVVALTGLVSYEFSRARDETGLIGTTGESFVVGLRDRLGQQGRLPTMPGGWHAEAVLRPAGDSPFAGDFLVSHLDGEDRADRRLQLALVDVSGKGVEAGARSLLLSGALGGLLGVVPPRDFLTVANAYLDQQRWEDGFATAVQLCLDLDGGHFQVWSAGHPPAAHYDAGTGRWTLLGAEGLALGLLAPVAYHPVQGRLDRGDALLLYTDGLVEVSGRDLSVGIDRLMGEAERLVQHGFAGGGERLVSRVAAEVDDDRGLVLLWREA